MLNRVLVWHCGVDKHEALLVQTTTSERLSTVCRERLVTVQVLGPKVPFGWPSGKLYINGATRMKNAARSCRV